ncbi:hypothetical protein PTTG_07213 [Puccinia triticina 1-1 BBBD Race 1]|uniref:Uncharacterized protein n=1 Tax=Puccinia triticina (isolate 1-1 / race 1 (BBBD)) TaxID=630390 RepID=A0A180GYF4_PUCT1|nr:hypothetical protein PTTG_07213 [Puccinia triticina 1-1 BBBD Race 1]
MKLTNKYYSLTDSSPIYRISICDYFSFFFQPHFSFTNPIIFAVLHPSFKDEYFKLALWEPKWISKAIRLAREMWTLFYKPQQQPNPVTAPISTSKASYLLLHEKPPPKTSVLAILGNAAAAQGGSGLTNTFDIWLAGGLILDGSEPVNPLNWWIAQKRAGNMHGALINMALDVLSCPGELNIIEILGIFNLISLVLDF